LELFYELGYEIKNGPKIAPGEIDQERTSYRDIIITQRLISALKRLNEHIPHEAIKDSIKQIKKIDSPDLIINNMTFHKLLSEGVPVEYTHESRIKNDIVKIIDFENIENNDWLVVNQYTVIEGIGQNASNRRPDMVVFINGLPISIIELKNPVNEDTTVKEAFNQLQTYKREIPSIFRTNEILMISDGYEAKVGSLSANWERFIPWRTIEGIKLAERNVLQMEVAIRGLFEKSRLLDYIRYFITFENDGKDIIKKSAAYHQFHAVNVAIEETLRATKKNGDKKIGIIWHTQGSGKSITMLFYTGKLVQLLNNPTIQLITDRNDLDNQLFNTFALSKELLRQEPKQAESRREIQELLKTAGGGVIFSTIQKFLPESGREYPLLSDRRNIIVIADEAHRSQYSFKKTITDKGLLKEGFAAHIRKALPNASFIGFTGTPIELVDRNTIQVFGDYISIYDISQAILDKTTVPIYYESRLVKIRLNEPIMNKIDKEFDEITEDEELIEREKLKSKWSRIAELVGAPDRLEEVAEDIVNHFENRNDSLDGKAMIVCMSREICINLYDKIIKIRPDWHSDDDKKGIIKVVISGSASDPEKFQPHVRNKFMRGEIKKRVINPDDPLKLVIVRDMWLTGFDAPCLHTMYIDKPMKGHTLMQAIARVNRVYKDKPGGLIVDYIGIGYYLKQALSKYSDQSSRENTGIPIETALELMHKYYEIVTDMFYGFDYSIFYDGTPLQRLQLLPAAMEHILSLKNGDGKKRFLDNLTSLNKAFSLATPHEDALAIRDDLAFFQVVRAGFIKSTPKVGKSIEDIEHAIRQLISRAVISDEVIDIFAAAGLQKPEISVLSETFLNEVKGLKHKNLAIELLHKLLNDQIKSHSRKNLVQSRSFAELLKKAIIKYQNQTIEAAAILNELIELAQKIQKMMKLHFMMLLRLIRVL